MPGGDRTGPNGAGPRTGRALGFCSGSESPGSATPGGGRGQMNRGRGRGGRGMGGRGRGAGYGRGNARNVGVAPIQDQSVDDVVDQQPLPPETAVVQEPAAPVPANEPSELDVLKQQLGALQHKTEQIRTRIEQLKTGE